MVLPYELTEYEPNKKLGMKGAMGPLAFRAGYMLEPVGSNTHVTVWLEFDTSGLLMLTKPLLVQMGKSSNGASLSKLKRILETAA